MLDPSTRRNRWLRFVVVRREVWKTTWGFKAAVVGVLFVLVQFTSPFWTRAVAESLICGEARDVKSVDAVVIDDLDLNYLAFERVRILREAGVSSRVVVPVSAAPNGKPAAVPASFVEVLARLSRVGDIETVP